MSKKLYDVLLDSPVPSQEEMKELERLRKLLWNAYGLSQHIEAYVGVLHLSALANLYYQYGIMQGKRLERARRKGRDKKAKEKAQDSVAALTGAHKK